MDLDKPEKWKKLDSINVAGSLLFFPDQVKECFNQAYLADIPHFSINSLIVTGMGGSSNAAKILQGIYESELSIPFEIFNDYGLPSWVNKKTLVIANSYSGNTEETLSSIEYAKKLGAKIIGIATGGKIGEMVSSAKIAGVVVNPGKTNPSGFPKTGLGVSLGALIGVLAKAGILNLKKSDVLGALNDLVKIRKNWNAKIVARWLHGHTPVFFGARPFIGALNAGRNAMCEISRNYTQFYDFPEVNHVLIEALMKPNAATKNKYLFFESEFNNERVLKRFKVTQGILDEMKLEYRTYKLIGKTKLSQALELAHYASWLGFYISMLDNTDPGPEPWIIKLKNTLSQPVH